MAQKTIDFENDILGPIGSLKGDLSQLSSEIENSSINDYECLIYKRNDKIVSSLSYTATEQVFTFDGVKYSTNDKKYVTLKSTNVYTSIGSIYLRLNELDGEGNVIVRNTVKEESEVIELNENTTHIVLCYVINYSIDVNSAVTYGSEQINLFLWNDVSGSKIEGFAELEENVENWNNEFIENKNVTYKYGYINMEGIPYWDRGTWYMTSGIIPIIEGETKVILSKLFTSASISTIAFFNSFNVSENTCIEYYVEPTNNIFDIPQGAVCYVTTVNPNYTDCVIMTQRIKLADDTRKDKIPANDMMYCDTDGTIRNIYNPYKKGGELQLSGQMHSHTYQGDGTQSFTPQELLEVHASCGYDFMTITDYGEYGVTKADTTDEVLFLFGSYEARCNPYNADDDNGQHIIVWNTNEVAEFPNYTRPQIMLDFANSGDKVASYAHPMSPELLQSDTKINGIVNCRFIEIYNGLTQLLSDISNEDNERAWNILLSGGHFTLGMGVSDTHTTTESYVREGCIKVFCNEKTRECIWENILDGNFYICSNINASINSISLSGDVVRVDIGQTNTTEWLDENGNVLNITTDNISTYKIDGSEKCVRARIHLTEQNYYVWTQPIFV